MAAHRPKITQAELTRYLKAYRDAGVPVTRTEINRDGQIVIYTTDASKNDASNPWDEA